MRKNIPGLRVFALLSITLCVCLIAIGGQPIVWEIGSRAELLKGEARGVSITDNVVITLAPRLDQVFNAEQPYIWPSASDPPGNVYLGTGQAGQRFKATPDRKGGLLFKA